MSFNLVEAANNFIPGELVDKAGSFLGESETGVKKALSGIIPAILGGLADKSSSSAGAAEIYQLAGEQSKGNAVPADFFATDGSSLLAKGAGVLHTIFGEKVNGLATVLSGFSGIRSASASSLLGIIAPVVMGFLGKHPSTSNLTASGLSSLLSSQKENISNAIPAGLNLQEYFSAAVPSIVSVNPKVPTVSHDTEDAEESAGNGLKWLVPILLLVLLAAASWYMYGTKETRTDETSVVTETTRQEKPAEAPAMAVTGKVDTSGNYIYDLGKTITIDLPNGAGKLTVGENSTENRLYKFLSDSTAKIDTVKGNWFEFTNVRFITGGSKIDSASSAQLKNVVAISKAFPAASFKLGGYTDNVGDSVFNTTLSQKRAEAVVVALKKMGAAATAVTGAKGYGPQFPIGDNATTEGKAMNRRVAINVKSK